MEMGVETEMTPVPLSSADERNPQLAESVMHTNYCPAFMNHVGGGRDPHDCWQEDGFWPERVSAGLGDLHVWACELALSYCNSYDVVFFLEYISGRMLPEMRKGFEILDCRPCESIANAMLEFFGAPFPRVDAERKQIVEKNSERLEDFSTTLWEAWEADDFDGKSNAYYENYCFTHGVRP
jgi:hypothetical protein